MSGGLCYQLVAIAKEGFLDVIHKYLVNWGGGCPVCYCAYCGSEDTVES